MEPNPDNSLGSEDMDIFLLSCLQCQERNADRLDQCPDNGHASCRDCLGRGAIRDCPTCGIAMPMWSGMAKPEALSEILRQLEEFDMLDGEWRSFVRPLFNLGVSFYTAVVCWYGHTIRTVYMYT